MIFPVSKLEKILTNSSLTAPQKIEKVEYLLSQHKQIMRDRRVRNSSKRDFSLTLIPRSDE